MGSVIANWISGSIPIAQLITSLLTHIAEVGIELISAKQVLEKCDRIAELGPLSYVGGSNRQRQHSTNMGWFINQAKGSNVGDRLH